LWINGYNYAGSDEKTDPSLRRSALPFFLFPGLLPAILAGCGQGYSPNTYASNAAQVEAAVQRGMIIGVRQVLISADGTVGAAAGGAAGGVTGAQVAAGGVVTALGAIGGTLVGGIGGTVAAQKVADTKGWEYIVQEEPGDKLVSVTQTSKTPLAIGTNVLVIAGTQQARIVPDYTVTAAAPTAKPPAASASKTAAAQGGSAPDGSATMEINIGPVTPSTGVAPSPDSPITVASDPTTPPASPAAASAATQVAAASAPGAAVTQLAVKSGSSGTATVSAISTAKPTPAAPNATQPAAAGVMP